MLRNLSRPRVSYAFARNRQAKLACPFLPFFDTAGVGLRIRGSNVVRFGRGTRNSSWNVTDPAAW